MSEIIEDINNVDDPNGEITIKREKKKEQGGSAFVAVMFLPLVYLYLETMIMIMINGFNAKTFLYLVVFSLGYGLIASGISMAPKWKGGKWFLLFIFMLIAVVFLNIELFCHIMYSNYMGLTVVFQSAEEVVGSYTQTIFDLLKNNWIKLVAMLVPMIAFLIFGRKLSSVTVKGSRCVLCFIIGILCIGLGVGIAMMSTSGIVSDREYLTDKFDYTQSAYHFGLINTTYTDAVYMVWGTPEAKPLNPNASLMKAFIKKSQDDMYPYNKLDIDFDTLIANETNSTIKNMHTYFSTVKPTKQNEYTGMFDGMNLVIVVAESWSPYAIDETHTPTLWNMAHTGWVFNNYYQPAWGVSTSDGEYSVLMGNVPKAGVNSMIRSKDCNNYWTMASTLSRQGYLTLAFHNNTYSYYSRNLTHENLGYSKWLALGNGLPITKTWPESDLEMIQVSTPYYIDSEEPFHVYYLTVSGHCHYNWGGNTMARRHKSVYADIDASEAVKAYKAANYELELAMTELLAQLEEAGKADNTVIVISPDHYPYGLNDGAGLNTKDYIPELYGYNPDRNFELYRSQLVIYNPAFAREHTEQVDKVCYSLDILPTLLNLFGVDYDSRLFAGRDIFSDEEGFVLFRNYSWITDRGRYNASSGVYTPNEGYENDPSYVKAMSQQAKDRVAYSKYVLENNYYNILFGE